MDNINFEKEELRVIWREKACYIGKQIAGFFEHENPSKAVSRAIKVENIVKGLEYDTLSGGDLKEFKLNFDSGLYDISRAPRLVIFYEKGVDKLVRYLAKILYDDYKFNVGKIENTTWEKQDNMLVNMFEDKEIHTFIINGRPCWIAVEIAGTLGYREKSRAITQCIKSEEFKRGKDYDVCATCC